MEPLDDVQILPLTFEYAIANAEALIELNRDNQWDGWTVENLLSDRPGKWHFSWVATRGGCPIGYAIVSQREHGVHLHHIVMGHAWRSRGVGLKLLWSTANKAVESGIGILTLKVYDNNKRAIAFYERLSFRNSGRLPTKELIEMTIDTQALMDACAERIRWSAWRTDSHNETVNETVMKP